MNLLEKTFKYFIAIVPFFLYSLLDGYYNFCKNCGRILSFEKNSCPYCNNIQKNKSGFDKIISPLEILKIRYAKGEITKREYEKMKKELC